MARTEAAAPPGAPTPGTPRVHRVRRALVAGAPAFVAVLPLLVLLVQQVTQLHAAGVPVADWAVLELATRATLDGDNLLGPYSRFAVHHPGPAMFAWMAPFYALAGRRFGGLVVGTVLVHLVAAVALVLVVQRVRGRGAAWVAALVVLAFTARFGLERFRDPWNPYWVVLPVALTGVAAWACWVRSPERPGAGQAGRGAPVWPLALAVLAGSVAVQSHAGAVPVVVALAGVGLLGVVGGHGPPTWRPLARAVGLASLVGLVLWAAPLWEQVTRDPGNLGLLVEQGRLPVEPPQSRRAVAHLTTASLSWVQGPVGRTFGPMSPFVDPVRAGAADVAAVGAGAAVLALGALQAVRRRRWDGAVLAVLPLLGALAVAVAGTRVRGDLWPYLFTTGLGVSLLWWTAAALVVAGWVRPRLPAARVPALRRATPAVVGLGALVVLVLARGQLDEAGTPFGDRWLSPQATAFAVAAEPWCAQPDPVRILIPQGNWGEAMALGDALARCGAHPRFEELWRFMAGDAFTERPGDAARAAVTLVVTSSLQPPVPGDERLVAFDPYALDRRLP